MSHGNGSPSYLSARDKALEAVDFIHKGCLQLVVQDGLHQSSLSAGGFDVLKGLLPITFRGGTYNIPVEIFLNRTTYPRDQPHARVVPTATMDIVPSVHVDGQTGDVRFGQYNWDGNFLSWMKELQRLFEQRPPVKAKRQPAAASQQQQPPQDQQPTKTSAPLPQHEQQSDNNNTTGNGPAQYQWSPHTSQDSYQRQQQTAGKESAALPGGEQQQAPPSFTTSSGGEMPPPPPYGMPPPQYGSSSPTAASTISNQQQDVNENTESRAQHSSNPYVAENVVNTSEAEQRQQRQKGAAPLPE